MTKAGYTHVCLPVELHNRLKALAAQKSTSIPKLIESLVDGYYVENSVGLKTVLRLPSFGIKTGKSQKKAPSLCGGWDSNPRTPMGQEPQSLRYESVRSEFIEWMDAKRYSKVHKETVLAYLDKYVKEIRGAGDIVRICSSVKSRHINYSLRVLLNFMRDVKGWKVDELKKAIPNIQTGVDLKRVSEDEVVESLIIVNEEANDLYKAAYNAALDSGLRLTEIEKLFKKVKSGEYEDKGSYVIAPIGMFRGMKMSYYAFITKSTLEMVKAVSEDFRSRAATKYLNNKLKKSVVSWKYLRKFAFSKMKKHGMSESAADFVQGRTPKTVGARHYEALLEEAEESYPRYAAYVEGLRSRVQEVVA